MARSIRGSASTTSAAQAWSSPLRRVRIDHVRKSALRRRGPADNRHHNGSGACKISRRCAHGRLLVSASKRADGADVPDRSGTNRQWNSSHTAGARCAKTRMYCGRERKKKNGRWSDRSDHRGDFFQADDAGERAHFALLVFAQLEQQRHRRRFQLLDFFGLGIDRHASRGRVGLPRRRESCGRRRATRSPPAASRIPATDESFRRSLIPAIWMSLSSA